MIVCLLRNTFPLSEIHMILMKILTIVEYSFETSQISLLRQTEYKITRRKRKITISVATLILNKVSKVCIKH